jgi:NAD(P)-dependent dehydrogenase (short-subunit alcohol dehydrogenase family)
MNKYFDISGEVILITGVCGILGSKYANYLLSQNAKVIGLDLSENETSLHLAKEYPSKYNFIECDITSSASILNVVDLLNNEFDIPTVLINNAAIDSPPTSSAEENCQFEDYPESSWDKVMNVNLKGMFLCCKHFGKLMMKNERGSVINISSIYGMVSPDQSIYEYRRKKGEIFYKPIAYSVSKSGVLNFTRYLANYWGTKGVRVNTLTLAGVFNNQDKEFLDQYISKIPIGRMAEPSDYFGPLHFLCSNSSIYMTGANLVVDGGWTSK